MNKRPTDSAAACARLATTGACEKTAGETSRGSAGAVLRTRAA